MKIGIDVSNLHSLSKTRGIGFYTENLYKALKDYSNNEISLVDNSKDLASFDVIHFPFFDLFRNTLRVPKGVKFIVTIHDVIPLIFPKNYPKGIRGRINLYKQKEALKKANAVITDSESSKKDIIKHLGVSPDLIHVVYLAPSEKFKKITDKSKLENISKKYNLPESFGVYIGGINWNKNLYNMADAAVSENKSLVFVGKGFETQSNFSHPELKPYKRFFERFSSNPLIKILGYLEEGDMIGVLNLAEFAIQASFYEGFGLPILEAQKCGIPVITSNVSSMPEVSGDGALLVDPGDTESIREAIRLVVNDSKMRRELVERGLNNVRNFTWTKAAAETNKIYEKVYTK